MISGSKDSKMLELVTNHCDTPTLYSTYSILEPHTQYSDYSDFGSDFDVERFLDK